MTGSSLPEKGGADRGPSISTQLPRLILTDLTAKKKKRLPQSGNLFHLIMTLIGYQLQDPLQTFKDNFLKSNFLRTLTPDPHCGSKHPLLQIVIAFFFYSAASAGRFQTSNCRTINKSRPLKLLEAPKLAEIRMQISMDRFETGSSFSADRDPQMNSGFISAAKLQVFCQSLRFPRQRSRR